jgi:hypothetical protein
VGIFRQNDKVQFYNPGLIYYDGKPSVEARNLISELNKTFLFGMDGFSIAKCMLREHVHLFSDILVEHVPAFRDVISRGCHPVDIHASATTKQRIEFLKNAGFIPYRCLITPDFPNLLVAGRSFSADGVASASVRVQASVMGLGQAAGVAAGMCIKSNVSVADVDITALRHILVEYGANLEP